MEKLAICSKILYDNDLLDKQNEILNKKNQISELNNKLNTPKILFENRDEWLSLRNDIYIILENEISEHIIDGDILLYNFNSNDRHHINNILFRELNKLTKYKYQGWCEITAFDIIYGIDASIQSLLYLNKSSDITSSELSIFIYKNIIWQLDDDTHSPCILEDIPYYPES